MPRYCAQLIWNEFDLTMYICNKLLLLEERKGKKKKYILKSTVSSQLHLFPFLSSAVWLPVPTGIPQGCGRRQQYNWLLDKREVACQLLPIDWSVRLALGGKCCCNMLSPEKSILRNHD